MADPDGAGGGVSSEWEYRLRKYLLLLATLVATVTYTAGLSPPAGCGRQLTSLPATLPATPSCGTPTTPATLPSST